jgi:hypothetical protein
MQTEFRVRRTLLLAPGAFHAYSSRVGHGSGLATIARGVGAGQMTGANRPVYLPRFAMSASAFSSPYVMPVLRHHCGGEVSISLLRNGGNHPAQRKYVTSPRTSCACRSIHCSPATASFTVVRVRTMIPWLRPMVFMWLLLRIDDNWEPVIIGGYDTEQYCRNEAERSAWGPRVFCVPAKQRTILGSGHMAGEENARSPLPGADLFP